MKERDDIIFVAIGDGNTKNDIKSLITPELKNNILFLSKHDPIEEIINIFDIGILLTDTNFHREGVSNSIMEYMALKKPVIATTGGGTNEIIKDGNTGLLVPNRASDEIVKKIIYLLNNTSKSKQIANNGQRLLKEKFNYTKMINSYTNLYYQINES